jgi:hypothetical protein
MTTTTVTASPILALDLGKYKSVACLHDQASGTLWSPISPWSCLLHSLAHLPDWIRRN